MRHLVIPALLTLLALGTPPAFADDFEDAMLSGNFEKAVALAEATCAKQPDNAVAAYNAGCACSRAGYIARSLEWLMKSARLGFSGIRSIRDDDDLDAARADPGFADVRAAVQANVTKRFDAFRAEAEKHEPIVILPPKHDPAVAAPLLIVLHGTGQNGRDMANAWKSAAAQTGAILVAPDALRPVRGTDGYSWVFRDESEWFVLHTIDEAKKKWAVGPVVLAGFSQGANIALMLGQSHPDRFQGVIPICGHYESDVATLPATDPRPRWYLMIGARDPWAKTYTAAERAFRGAGMTVRRDVVRGVGHAMPKGRSGATRLRRAIEWTLRTPKSSG